MTAILAPLPKLRFEDNSGNPAAGFKLFTYAAGTTTKQLTYIDSIQSANNTNPIILDSRGECDCWMTPGLFYKFVLSPSTDTDPPTNAIWSVDNVPGITDLNNVTLTGIPLAPTAAPGTNTTQIATTAFVQASLASIQSQSLSNPFKNQSCELFDSTAPVTLTGSYLGGSVMGALAKVIGTLSAGTLTNGTASIGITGTQVKCAGVTGDITSFVAFCFRIGGPDLSRFSGQVCSFSAKVRQESGLTANVTIKASVANALNDFSAVTQIGTSTSVLPTATNTTSSLNGVTVPLNSNGLQLEVLIQPGGTFTTKDFYVTDIEMNAGATASFVPATFAITRESVNDSSIGIFKDTGAVNVMTVTTGDYIPFLFDGQKISVNANHANTTTTPTLTVNGFGPHTIVSNDGTALPVAAMSLNGIYVFIYDKANTRWKYTQQLPVLTTPTMVVLSGSGNFTVPANITSIQYEIEGGSGGGGSHGDTNSSGGGGGGGGYAKGILTVIPGNVISYSQGVGGGPNTDGTSTTFGSIIAGGGKKGSKGTNTTSGVGGAGGAGGTSSGGTYNSTGNNGGDGFSITSGSGNNIPGGMGGACHITTGGGAGSSFAGAPASGSSGVIIVNY